MSIRTVNQPTYVTTDGEIFTDMQIATAHQVQVDHLDSIEKYFDANDVAGRTRTTLKQHMIAYMAFLAGGAGETTVAEDEGEPGIDAH